MPDPDNPNVPLLSELEALQTLLKEQSDHDDIPVLDDILEPSPQLAERFGEALDDEIETKESPADWDENDHSREVFLQALIDDLLPQIEAELRQRLLKLDQQLLEQWYQQSRRP